MKVSYWTLFFSLFAKDGDLVLWNVRGSYSSSTSLFPSSGWSTNQYHIFYHIRISSVFSNCDLEDFSLHNPYPG